MTKTLHVISSSPFSDDRLSSCLRLLGNGDGLLLCGDATYAAQPGTQHGEALAALQGVALYALAEDIQARGLQPDVGIEQIDYPGFVALACRFSKVNTWL
ncbi:MULTISPECIES: sulfurtransferase complex subunit TusB [unclassified Pseudomonas]|uniref:sulfurtransferase complex subunit TusB n=1 Tax=unclassified Pseudomonas TaxID=196821 RepID=UPI000484667E|nr:MULTISPECIES: sulfurtransferase complex subunit TusB [unclassified Pseudomonas]PZW71650.1 tRNA 2-thiouridine synthesizing protein B [Pseudomonas sp. URMO17WK12:I1]